MSDAAAMGAGLLPAPSQNAITPTEQYALHNHEQVIERGLATFHEVGTALLAIRDERLYRARYGTFEEYCQDKWSMTPQHAGRLIGAAEVMATLEPIGFQRPDNERQVRELAKVAPEAQLAAWAAAIETAPDGKVTANHMAVVAHVFEEMLNTGAIDPGDGIAIATSDVVKAAVTEETYERMMRQQEYTRKGKDKPKTNRAGDASTPQGFDACQTPAYALDPLLPYLNPVWLLWEPAQGEGLLVEGLYDAGYKQDQVAIGDLLTGQNFFDYEPSAWDCLVTNPPYSIKYDWLRRCYDLGKPFALLLPVETLGAKTAQEFFRLYGVQVIFMDKRINFKMPNIGFEGSAAQFPVAWFTWQLDLESDMRFANVNNH
jgi:hypothetical protein